MTEDRGGVFAPELYQPLRELGKLKLSHGYFETAELVFRRMQHIKHREFGVETPEQIESIDYVMRAMAGVGSTVAIDQQQHFRFSIATRSFGRSDSRLLEAKLKLADWYQQTRRFNEALALYEEARLFSDDFPRSVELRLLRSEALTLYLAGQCCASEVLLSALELMDDHVDDPRIELTQALQDYLDLRYLERREGATMPVRSKTPGAFIGFSKPKDILKLMMTQTNSTVQGDVYFDFGEHDAVVATVGYPVAMCGNVFDRLRPRHGAETRFDITVQLSSDGRPEGIDVAGDGPSMLKRYLKDSLRTGKFRPATDENGLFVQTKLSFTQTFKSQLSDKTIYDGIGDWGRMLVAQTCQTQGVQRI